MTQKYFIGVVCTGILPMMVIGSAGGHKKQGRFEDLLLSEYKELREPIKENIVDKLKFVRGKTEDIGNILKKRLAIIENKVKQELGNESEDSFLKRTRLLENKYAKHKIDREVLAFRPWAIQLQEGHYEKLRQEGYIDLPPLTPAEQEAAKKFRVRSDKIRRKIAAWEENPDREKLFKIDRLLSARENINSDLDLQKRQLTQINERIENPDTYLEDMNKKAAIQPRYLLPTRDPMPELSDALETYSENVKKRDEEALEKWISESDRHKWYAHRANKDIVNKIDMVAEYDMDNVDRALKDTYGLSWAELYDRLGLKGDKKSSGPMFSPMERTYAQRAAAYFVARMRNIAARFNHFTSAWFAQNRNKFAVTRLMKMPKLVQPKTTGRSK